MNTVSKRPVISVIVPIFNQWEVIPKLFESLSDQTLPSNVWEIIVVDNGSDFPPLDNEVPLKNSKLINCSKPGSYAARNAGVRASSGDLLVFTDADCIPDSNWLEKLYISHQKHGFKSLLAGDVLVKSFDSIKPTSVELYDIVTGLPQRRYVSKGCAVTANLTFSRAVYERVGGFDEDRFSGGDAIFCQKAVALGFDLVFLHAAIVYHPARKNWSEIRTKIRRMKGGQLRVGAFKRRAKFLLMTIIPPVWKFYRILKSDRVSLTDRVTVCFFQLLLWFFELYESILLLCGKPTERR